MAVKPRPSLHLRAAIICPCWWPPTLVPLLAFVCPTTGAGLHPGVGQRRAVRHGASRGTMGRDGALWSVMARSSGRQKGITGRRMASWNVPGRQKGIMGRHKAPWDVTGRLPLRMQSPHLRRL
eukprot:351237-Chlamydomonas_euryale.AAC.5